MDKYYVEVIERLQRIVFNQINEIEELKDKIEKLNKENKHLRLENRRLKARCKSNIYGERLLWINIMQKWLKDYKR